MWVAVPPPGDLSDPGIEPESPAALALQADSLPMSHGGKTFELCWQITYLLWSCSLRKWGYNIYITELLH